MQGNALRILKKVAHNGEIKMSEALALSKTCCAPDNHMAQYPLALLLEENYVGITLNIEPPVGAENMREFNTAISLHMYTLPKDGNGTASYMGIESNGAIEPASERVFLKAKGALYLDERKQKFWERVWAFIIGLLASPIVLAVANSITGLKVG